MQQGLVLAGGREGQAREAAVDRKLQLWCAADFVVDVREAVALDLACEGHHLQVECGPLRLRGGEVCRDVEGWSAAWWDGWKSVETAG